MASKPPTADHCTYFALQSRHLEDQASLLRRAIVMGRGNSSDAASLLGMTRTNYVSAFKRRTGETPKRYYDAYMSD